MMILCPTLVLRQQHVVASWTHTQTQQHVVVLVLAWGIKSSLYPLSPFCLFTKNFEECMVWNFDIKCLDPFFIIYLRLARDISGTLTDGSVNLYRSLGHTATRDYDLAMLIVIRRWILDEIFIDTDFLVSLLVSESEYFRRRKGLFRNSVTGGFTHVIQAQRLCL